MNDSPVLMTVHPAFRYLPLAALALLLAACSSSGTRLRMAPTVGQVAETLGKPDRLGGENRDLLKSRDLLTVFKLDPGRALRELRGQWPGKLSEHQQVQLAGIASAGSEAIDVRNPAAALGLRVAAAEIAWPLAIAEPSTPDRRSARAIFNHNCGELSRHLGPELRSNRQSIEIPGPERTYRLRIARSGPDLVDPGGFDTLTRSDRLELRNLDNTTRRRVEGLGADVVGHITWSAEREREDPILGISGMALPLNAMLDFSGGAGGPSFVFHDMTLANDLRIAGRTIPLCADYTVPFATLLEHSPASSSLYGIKAMINSLDYQTRRGTSLKGIEPWRNDKIPVVLVHGLMSSPATWLSVFNEIYADPVLKQRYQVLAFRYQTGFPLGENSSELRKKLYQLRQDVDPGGRNPNFNQMILIGHSMGGLLSNIVIRESKGEILKVFFNRPLDELDLTAEQRRKVREQTIFQPVPFVKRAVFVASPHRGSDLAARPLGNFGSWLIRLPIEAVTLGIGNRESFDGSTPYSQQILKSGINSIKALQPDNPLLGAVLELPLNPAVTCHSVIGNHKPKVPVPESSDGLVKYWSSHLDGTASEEIVHASHTSITHDQDAIEEMKRILRLHAGL